MEKEKMSGVPEAASSVTSTVDAQRDASTKSLVSRVTPFVEMSYRPKTVFGDANLLAPSSMQILFTAISLCAPIASGLAMAFPVFALTVYQDSGGRNPDNPLVRPLDTEQGSWFGQHPKTANLPLPLISP